MNFNQYQLTRRRFLRCSTAMGIAAGFSGLFPAYAKGMGLNALADRVSDEDAYDLAIGETGLRIDGRATKGITMNGTVPGPLLRFREGKSARVRVTNNLAEDTSIHWHGLILPFRMDGVPGVTFAGIRPNETFVYHYELKQSGTYWYHSHSGLQEQLGHYGPIIIDPIEPEPFKYDREYVVMLSDWTFEDPANMLAKLKKVPGYYNYQKRTVSDFFRDASAQGFRPALQDWLMWGRMRMDPSDISDVTGHVYTYLMNGHAPESNWTALFKPGERVRLRFINAGTMTYFDVRIPGLPMTVVQADGQNVQPVTVDEFRIANGETYDVIIEPQQDRAYTLFAESADRSGFARGTVATRQGVSAPIPPQRMRPLRSMADMGMAGHGSGGHGGHAAPAAVRPAGEHNGHDMSGTRAPDHIGPDMSGMQPREMDHGSTLNHGDMTGTNHSAMEGAEHAAPAAPAQPATDSFPHGPDHHGPGNAAVAEVASSRVGEPGAGLGEDGWRVLVYSDLRSVAPYERRTPTRDVELHITGNMERYMWSFDGKTFSEAQAPIKLEYNERIRLILVNDTMMEHPIHLHGMWMELENGTGTHRPRKHTVNVKPAERMVLEVTADAPGTWALHCHLLLHMDLGMFRLVQVGEGTVESVHENH